MGSLRTAVNNTIALGFSVSDFNQEWSFSTDFRNKTPASNSTKIRPVGAALIPTDMTKLITHENAPNAE
jgi:hypothetical protein